MLANYVALWQGEYGIINQLYMMYWHFVAIPMLAYIGWYPIAHGSGEWKIAYPCAVVWMTIFYWIGINYG